MKLTAKPTTLREANAFVQLHHRHNKPVRGHRFSLKAVINGDVVGVVIVGRPVARNLDDGETAEITRLCVSPDAPKGTCSFLYQTCRRAWNVMGGVRIVTYTLESESGASLRGAGWEVAAKVKPRANPWCSADRTREAQAVFDEPKLRWEPAA